MRIGFIYLLFILSLAFFASGANAQQKPPAGHPLQEQPQQEQHQQEQSQQSQQQEEPDYIPQYQSYQSAPMLMGVGIDTRMLQGQWETKCVESVPDKWLVPSQFPPNPGNGQRGIYTFDYNRIIYQVNEYRDPFCDAADLVATSHSEVGMWVHARTLPHYPATSEIDFYFKYCSGLGCSQYDPGKGLYSSESRAFQFRTVNELLMGNIDPATGEVNWLYRYPLYKPGYAPEESR